MDGFSDENIRDFTTRFYRDEERSSRMLDQAREFGVYELLRVPVLLLMSCVIYHDNNNLPRTKTEMIGKDFFCLFLANVYFSSHVKMLS